jgi:hypothetical protein
MPKKSKKDEPCFTRSTKSGKKYTTCVGAQKREVKINREISKLHGRTKKGVTKAEFQEARGKLRKAVPVQRDPLAEFDYLGQYDTLVSKNRAATLAKKRGGKSRLELLSETRNIVGK